jgi:hypothetical protein
MAFLDLDKAFDRVNHNQLRQILNRRGMPYHLIEVIKNPYKNTSVQTDTGRKILDKICQSRSMYDKGVIYHRLFLIST